jgi:hypothetical protein
MSFQTENQTSNVYTDQTSTTSTYTDEYKGSDIIYVDKYYNELNYGDNIFSGNDTNYTKYKFN